MDFLLLFSVLLFLFRPGLANQQQEQQGVKPISKYSLKSFASWTPSKHTAVRPKRSTPHKITECVFATSEENFYYYETEESSDEVCGAYLFAEPDQVIEVHFEYLNVPCESGGLVTFLDGWELNGKFFPGVHDHEKPFALRHKEFCGTERTEKVFVTTQNAGMLHYRVPEGSGFGFYVKFRKNPFPCNILVESEEDIYTLRNYGRAGNCTLVAVFPAKIQLLDLDVGAASKTEETAIFRQCGDGAKTDELQIGGSGDLDSSDFVLFEDVCGSESFPGTGALVIGCEVSVVRLVSSGRYDNSATFSVAQPEELNLLETTHTCEV